MIEKPGIYDLDMETYQRDPVKIPSLTRGMIRSLVSECPAKGFQQNPRLNPGYVGKTSSAFDLGACCHSLLLEGIDIADPLDFPDWRTNASKDAAAKSRENGKIPLLRANYERAVKVVNAAIQYLAESELGIHALRAEGYPEQSYIWKEKDGVWCRIRPDWVSSDKKILLDYKTTGESAEPSAFAKKIISHGTDIQAWFYSRGVKKLTEVEPRFVLLVQEIDEPYLCSSITLSNQFLDLGKQKVKEASLIWKECLSTGLWTGYPKRIMQTDAPSWAVTQWEEQKLTRQLLAQDAQTEDGMPF